MKVRFFYEDKSFTSEFLIDYSYTEILHNDLKQADNSFSLTIPYNLNIQNFLNRYANNNIKAVVYDDDQNSIFYGFVRKSFSFGKQQRNNPIKIELVSPSYFLDLETSKPIYLVNAKLTDIVNALLREANYSATTDIINIDLPIFSLDSGSNILETISELLKEYGYTFDFDANGNIIFYELFNVPKDKTTITNYFDGSNCLDEITINKNEQEYNGVSLKWNEIKHFENTLVFSDTTGGTALWSCSIPLKAGEYLGEYSEGETPSYYVEYDNENGEVVYCENARLILETSYPEGIRYSFENCGTKGLVQIHNVSNITINIHKLDIVGDCYVMPSTDIQKTSGTKKQEYISNWIQTKQAAKNFALNYADYLNYSDYKVNLKSKTNYKIGEYVKIEENGLGTIYGRIVKKTYGYRTPINYEIEAISEYENATEKESEKNKSVILSARGPAGLDGKGIKNEISYYLATNLKQVSRDSEGWTTEIQEITSEKKYLWTYRETIYTDETKILSNPVCIGAYGDTGKNGEAGVRSSMYLGKMENEPTMDFIKGDWYLNTTSGFMFYYNGSAWQQIIETQDYRVLNAVNDIIELAADMPDNEFLQTVASTYTKSLMAGNILAEQIGASNIVINNNGSIQSSNYIPSMTGFYIDSFGNAEFTQGSFSGSISKTIFFDEDEKPIESRHYLKDILPDVNKAYKLIFFNKKYNTVDNFEYSLSNGEIIADLTITPATYYYATATESYQTDSFRVNGIIHHDSIFVIGGLPDAKADETYFSLTKGSYKYIWGVYIINL